MSATLRERRSAAAAVPERLGRGVVLAAATAVTVELGGTRVLDGADLVVRAGEVVALAGPNGAGKSTLLGVLTGDVAARGPVSLFGRAIHAWSAGDLARRRAVLPQQSSVGFPFTVDEVVRMGRAPWRGTVAEDADETVVRGALADAEVAHLRHRPVPSLSGGERARVALARVLAQCAQLLLLDEPTAALDLHHQELTLQAVRRQAASGSGAVVVLHDLGLAAAHADRVVLLARGGVVADGSPADVLRTELLSDVYQHPIEVLAHPTTGIPLVVPRR